MSRKKRKGTKKKGAKGTDASQRSGVKGIPEAPVPQSPEKQDAPVSSFLADYDLDTEWGVGLCLEDLIHSMEGGEFLRWEAVVRDEQGLPLTAKQSEALDELLSFSDDDSVHYIDGLPRPSESWYEIVREIAPKLVLDPFTAYGIHDEIVSSD